MKRFKAQITNLTNNKNFLENNIEENITIASLYINGDFKESKILLAPPPESTPNLCLGSDQRIGATSQYFKGTLYSLYLFDKVRTPSQIKNDVGKTSIDSNDIIYEKVEPDGMTFKLNLNYIEYIGNDPSVIPLTILARLTINPNSSDRQGVIVGNYQSANRKLLNIEIYFDRKVRVYYYSGNEIRFSSDLKNYLLANKDGSLKPFDIAITLLYVERFNKKDVNIKYATDDENSSLTTDLDSSLNITKINEPYLNLLKDRMETDNISLENNNIFFYKVQDILKLYTKDKDGNIYPINVQSVNDARGVSASAIEPILYNIFMNKLLDYSIADTFDRTYLQNNDLS